MRLYYWLSPGGNFGDDMNKFLWSHFAPELFDVDDDVLFVGVGTVLWDALPKARLRVVMGTGTGYGRFPHDLHDGGWRILAVRGPLTAQAVGNPELAVTDPAVLLPLLPDFRIDRNSGTAFIPHWITAAGGRWQEACRLAGIEFIDPRDEARSVVRRIASSALVIAESMHGAIVADAFRVPWIPVVSARNTPLKWHDWALSLGMQYQPVRISNLNSPRRTLVDMISGRLGSPNPATEDYGERVQAELTAFLTRAHVAPSAVSRGSRPILRDSMSRMLDLAARPLIVKHGMRTLRALLDMPPMLSPENVLASKRAILLQRIEALKEDYAAGRLG